MVCIVSSIRSTSSGDALTGIRRKSATRAHAVVTEERKPGVSIRTGLPFAAISRAIVAAASVGSSTTVTPPKRRSDPPIGPASVGDLRQ